MALAAFVSAGGYHHHIGLNVWESRGGTPAPGSITSARPGKQFAAWVRKPFEISEVADTLASVLSDA